MRRLAYDGSDRKPIGRPAPHRRAKDRGRTGSTPIRSAAPGGRASRSTVAPAAMPSMGVDDRGSGSHRSLASRSAGAYPASAVPSSAARSRCASASTTVDGSGPAGRRPHRASPARSSQAPKTGGGRGAPVGGDSSSTPTGSTGGGSGSMTSPMPLTSAAPAPSRKNGTSAPSWAATAASPSRRRHGTRVPARPGASVAAASALPPASPAAIGMRLRERDPQRRHDRPPTAAAARKPPWPGARGCPPRGSPGHHR